MRHGKKMLKKLFKEKTISKETYKRCKRFLRKSETPVFETDIRLLDRIYGCYGTFKAKNILRKTTQVYILVKNGKVEGVYSSEDNAIKASLEDFDTIYNNYEILVCTVDN